MYDVDGGATQFDVGVSWTEGAIELGLQFANNDNAAAADVSKTAVGLTYTLGPGILIGGQAANISTDGANDVTQVILGTTVFF